MANGQFDFANAFSGGGGYSFSSDDTTRQELSAATDVSSGNIVFNKNKTSPLVYALAALALILWYKSRKER